MRTCPPLRHIARAAFATFFALAVSALATQAATVWTGPRVTWTKSASTPSDVILPGKVELKRGTRDVLFNVAAGETAAGSVSPKDTLWAFGDIANFATLQYASLESLRNGNLAARIRNKPMVVHIVSADIYFAITVTTWGSFGAGTVSYNRTTPAAVVPPTVNLTAPANNSVFAAPASIALAADASVSGGTVTNVEFFAGAASLGKVTTSPFNLTGNIAAAGTYSLTAVATVGGVSATSAPVTISIVAPVDVALAAPALNGSQFSLSYSGNPGLRYVVQRAESLTPPILWVNISTNTAAANSSTFSEAVSAAPDGHFYRIGRLPNP